MSKSKNAHTEEADELINSITEILMRAEGETIAEVANLVGLNVKYLGDSLFEVKED